MVSVSLYECRRDVVGDTLFCGTMDMMAINYGVTWRAAKTNSKTVLLGRLCAPRRFQRGAQMAVSRRKAALYLGFATRRNRSFQQAWSALGCD